MAFEKQLAEIRRNCKVFSVEYARCYDNLGDMFERISRVCDPKGVKINIERVNKFKGSIQETASVQETIREVNKSRDWNDRWTNELIKYIVYDSGQINIVVSQYKKLCSDSFQEDLRKQLSMTYKEFQKKMKALRKLLVRNQRLAAVIKQSEQVTSKKKSFKQLFHGISRARLKLRKTVGKARVYLDIRSAFDLKKELIAISDDAIGHSNLIRCSNLYDRFFEIFDSRFSSVASESQKKAILKIRKNASALEEDLLRMIGEYCVLILERHPEILRASRVNIYIKVMPHKELNVRGKVDDKSTFSDIFIMVSVSEELMMEYFRYRYGLNAPLKLSYYDVLSHEMTHTYDYLSFEESQETLGMLNVMLGEQVTPSTIELIYAMTFYRSEGLAMISSTIKKNTLRVKGQTIICIPFNSEVLDLQHMEDESNQVLELWTGNNAGQGLERFLSSGIRYRIGEFMALVILLASVPMIFWVKSDREKRSIADIVMSEASSSDQSIDQIMSNREFKEVPAKNFTHFMGAEGGLTFMVMEKDLPRVKQFFVKIALMNPAQFFMRYVQACHKIGIGDRIFSESMMKKFNHKNLEQTMKYLAAMGFK